ncbi:hypothetical protein B0H16DRAFT_1805971 [Mycena metata]|uniref:Uncharacterized protein n=1 Tax=Mycena metata TaxID=1033252 RepID=A0AAD7NI41_9AGAR|nr:hypothetical protein B0H16DRAFT_1805971 [Mycena metata]
MADQGILMDLSDAIWSAHSPQQSDILNSSENQCRQESGHVVRRGDNWTFTTTKHQFTPSGNGLGPTAHRLPGRDNKATKQTKRTKRQTRFQAKGSHVEKVALVRQLDKELCALAEYIKARNPRPLSPIHKLSTHIETDSREKKRKAPEEDDDPNKRIRSESPERPLPPINTETPAPGTTPIPNPVTNLRFRKMPGTPEEATAGMRTSVGVIQMTNGQQYTAPPKEGFPHPECVESPLRNTTDLNRAAWAGVKGHKAFIRVYRAKYAANTRDVVAKLAFVIKCLVDTPRVIISPPDEREKLDERHAAPWNFMVSELTEEAHKTLIAQGWWSTPTITFYIFDFNLRLPRYIMTLQNLCLAQDEDETRKFVARLVKDKLKSLKEAVDFLAKHSGGDTKAATDALDTIEVRALEITLPGPGEVTDLLWNVYFTPPSTIDFFRLLEWTAGIRTLTFPSNLHGTGVPRVGPDQLFCIGCKGYDHPTGLCPLPLILGWFGVTTKSITADDKTLSKADERNERNNDKKSKSGQGSRAGGGGNKNRGGNGNRKDFRRRNYN